MMSFDDGFRRAADGVRGTTVLPEWLVSVRERIARETGVEPAWLELDHIRIGTPRIRLAVWIRTEEEQQRFKEGPYGNFDRALQERVASLVARRIPRELLPSAGARVLRMSRARFARELLVVFPSFARPAREVAHLSVPEAEIDAWVAALGLGPDLWTWRRLVDAPVLLAHTDAQADRWRADVDRERWADDYYALVKPRDEFGALDRASIAIAVSSKETFDRDFESSWGYFWR